MATKAVFSFPGIYTKVKRELRAVVRYQDVNGETQELDGEDLTARCALHETDHCDGIVFLNRMSALKRELSKRKIKKLKMKGEWNGLVLVFTRYSFLKFTTRSRRSALIIYLPWRLDY